jgi:CRISPR-associated protein Cas1
MLNELNYCERLFYIMHVQGFFEESPDTIEGTAQHQRAEARRKKGSISGEDMWGQAPLSLYLGNEELDIVGKLDAIAFEDGNWVPVEAKHSSAPDRRELFHYFEFSLAGNAWPNDQIQLCAQGLLLRGNGYCSDFGYLYYRGNRKRIRVDFTDDLRKATVACIMKARELQSVNIMPKPLCDSNKCFRCSMNYVCLPDETNYLIGASTNLRRIVTERIDGGMLYVSEHGARLGKSGECLVVNYKDGRTEEIPIKDIIHVTLMGNVQCSTQLIHNLLASGIGISYLSSHGKLIGITIPPCVKNIYLRQKQFVKFQHSEISLKLACWIVFAKISNQRTMLRRNGVPTKKVLSEMKDLRDKALVAPNLDTLRGLEGRAGRLYMETFPGMLKENEIDNHKLMSGRNRRPPKDPVNALLSLGYTLLVRDVMAACVGVGLDPLFGFYHRIEPGRPALVLDLMEPFRSLIVDSTVIRVLNTQEITLSDFYWGKDSCQLKNSGRNVFFSAYERRMHDKIKHPLFNYQVSYRRILDLEVRLLARFLEGELAEYHPLTTR